MDYEEYQRRRQQIIFWRDTTILVVALAATVGFLYWVFVQGAA